MSVLQSFVDTSVYPQMATAAAEKTATLLFGKEDRG